MKNGALTEAGRKIYRTNNGTGDLTKEGWLLYHNKDGSMSSAQKLGYFNECEGDDDTKLDEYLYEFDNTKVGKKLRAAYDKAYEAHFETGEDKTGERFIKAEEDYLKAQYKYANEKVIDFYGVRDMSILTARYLKAGGSSWMQLRNAKDIDVNDINRSISYFDGDRQKLVNFYNTRVNDWRVHTA